MSETTSRGPQETNQRGDREDTVAATQPRSTAAPMGGRRCGGTRGARGRGGSRVGGGGVPLAWLVGRERGRGAAADVQPWCRQDLSATTPVNATLGYAGSYTGDRAGRRDADLAAVGRAGDPARGRRCTGPITAPRWCCCTAACRTGGPWTRGSPAQDVTQLNHDLVDLGYADRADISALGWDYFSWETAVRGAAAGVGAGGLQPAGVAAAGVGGVRAGGAAGQPGDRAAWAARRPGRC